VLHYQPKVHLETGAITGVEALLRWQHPERGLMSASQFLPIAEECGLIVPIGKWVMREACRQSQAWIDAGLEPTAIAVNVSAREFREKGFLEGLSNILTETRLDPRLLEIELTENEMMRHGKSSAAAHATLKKMGVRLTVDDFGTGYSSLSSLKTFPIDTMKIDQSFVHHVTTDGENAAIVSAMIGMGSSLKHSVVAEGVETRGQLAFLRERRCEQGQGDYFSRPLRADECTELLRTGISKALLA
jgi:EAL domain-containing protein (putative c-di-GMP-specific phosphodiesterase class I)